MTADQHAASAVGISVVVPTFGNPASVERLLESLRSAVQRLPAGVAAETLIVDDSRSADAAVIAEICHRYGARYVRGPHRVGAKRNYGAWLARFPILFFIDSDCIADADVLRVHLTAHAEYDGRLAPSGRPAGAVAGLTLVEDVESSRAWRVVSHSLVVNSPWLWAARFTEVWWAATANLSVRREAFDRAGGFDHRTFTVVGGEDVDFGVRLSEAGFATVCRRDAVVWHATDGITRLGQFRGKMFRYGRACVYNCVRQPQHARWSANPVSLAAAGTTLGLTLRRVAWRGPVSGKEERVGGWLAAGSLAAVAATFAIRTARIASRHRISAVDAAGMLSVDWAFHAGIFAESLRRGRLALALRRYDYSPPQRFYTSAVMPQFAEEVR